MPGIATHFKILDLTLAKLAGVADLTGIRDAIKAHPQYAYLGAIGPAITDFMPGNRVENPLLDIWAEIFSLIGDGMRVEKGLLTVLSDIRTLLAQFQPIVESEDFDALNAIKDELGKVTEVDDQLQAIFDQIPFIILPIGAGIMANMRPAVSSVSINDPVPQNNFWELRNFLYWKKTGDFAKKLLDKAKEDGVAEHIAYAYGYLVSYVANVTGSPFVNSSIGAPYRNQWWRHRWVNNYIDAWVHGKYETGATMTGDIPNPPYEDWTNLCDADLHKKIELSEHDPQELMAKLYKNEPLSDTVYLTSGFGQYWISAFKETYNNPDATVGDLEPSDLNDAYLLTWLILWFQTSSDGLGCNIQPEISPSVDCGEEPSWVTPEASDEGGTVTVPAPPEPEIESDPDVGKIISGVILALLGLGFLATGNAGAGGVAIWQGVEDIIEGASAPNWDKLKCDLFWYNLYIYHGVEALHEILSVAAFRYPRATDLGIDSIISEFFPDIIEPYDSGKTVTKSRAHDEFPKKVWSTGFNWMDYPSGALEMPSTIAYMTAAYPSFFIDDPANPLSNGEVRIGGSWPVRTSITTSAAVLPIQFGNAVENAIDLFRHLDGDFPNWNLDADRGLAYHTWEYLNGLYLDPLAIAPEN